MTTCDDETASRASKGPPSSLTVSKFKWLLVSESGHSDVERDLNAFEGLDPSYGGSDLCHGEPIRILRVMTLQEELRDEKAGELL